MADGPVLVRPATDDDLDAVIETTWEVAAEGRWLGTEVPFDRAARRSRFAANLGVPGHLLLVAEAGSIVIAHLSVNVAPYGVGDLGMAIVKPWRGQGIGRRLLDEAIDWARQAGAHKLALEAWPDNDRALALYERAGFVYEGRKTAHYRRRDGQLWDAVVMGLSLRPAPPMVRPVRDQDGWDLIALIGACWAEYPGCVMDAHGEYPELLAPARAMDAKGGAMWVVDGPGGVIASIARGPVQSDLVELQKLYVARRWRRRGLARHLVRMVEEEAAGLGAVRVELWSDSRFVDAHRSYEVFGYQASGRQRHLDDLSHTVEYHYVKVLSPTP